MVSDVTCAWSCATSFLMCEAKPSPDLDGADEGAPAPVARRQALVGVHARQLLVITAAEPDRLAALVAECRGQAAAAARLRGGWNVARLRRGPPGRRRWTYALRALTQASRRDIAARWTVASELAAAAAALVREAGADVDGSARDRLLTDAERVLLRVDWAEFCGPGRTPPQPPGD